MIIGSRLTQCLIEYHQGTIYKGLVFEDINGFIYREMFPLNCSSGLVDWVLVSHRYLGFIVTNDETVDGVRTFTFGGVGSFYVSGVLS